MNINPKRKRLNTQINGRIRSEAQKRGANPGLIRYQLVFQCFLRRLFSTGSNDWVLTGGAALLMRRGDGRFTQDLDLARSREWNDTAAVEKEFHSISGLSELDPFRFEVKSISEQRGGDPDGYSGSTLKAKLAVYLEATEFVRFSIDITTQRHTQFPIDNIEIVSLLSSVLREEVSTFSINVTPVETQLADKICAMYEPHRDTGSTRYHDLADIISIIQTLPFSADALCEKLRHEAQRRKISLPDSMVAPNKGWSTAFKRNAPGYRLLPDNLHPLDAALEYVGETLNPILNGSRTHGQWNPTSEQWDSQ